VIDEYVFGSAY